MNNIGKVLIAFGTGAAVGAMLGILFAPDKGSRTRRKIKEAGMKIVDEVEDNIQKTKEQLDHLRTDFEKKVKEEREKMMHTSKS